MGTRDPQQADQLLNRLLSEATALNVPLTPVTGTFLIKIFTQQPSQQLVNQAVLIERYVELMLEKFGPQEIWLGTFDFKNKRDLLSAIAERMVRTGDYGPEKNVAVSWIISYLNEYGLKYAAHELLNYFVAARIFALDGNHVRFRLKAFLEFSIASRMLDDETFRRYVFDADRYLKFAHEIVFYAALSRRDKDRLNEIFSSI